MAKLVRFTVAAVAGLGMGPVCWGALVIQPDFAIKSAVLDASNLSNGATLSYTGQLDTGAGDADVFLNSVALVPGGHYDSNLNLALNPAIGFTNNQGQYYTLGSPLAGGTHLTVDNLLTHSGAMDAGVGTGLYDFSLEFRGGGDANAQDVLGKWDLQLEVVPKIDVTVGGVASPAVIGPGGVSTVSTTLTNNMSNRTVVVNTWGFINSGLTNGTSFLQGNFVGSWFGKSVGPGQSLSGDHTTWTATPGLPGGVYGYNNSELDLVGGLYAGDSYWFPAVSPAPSVTLVVPEPAGVAGVVVMAVGAAGAMRRRRGNEKYEDRG